MFGVTTRYRYVIAVKDLMTDPRWDFIGGAVGDLAIDTWRVELLVGGGAVEINSITSKRSPGPARCHSASTFD